MAAVYVGAQSGATFTQGVNGMDNGRVSSGGKYLVGTSKTSYQWGFDNVTGFESYLTDLTTGETTWMTQYDEADYSKLGAFADVNDEGVICGTMKDLDNQITITDMGDTYTLPLNVAAIWKDGQAQSLGLGTYGAADFSYFADGTFATAISDDAKTVVGYVSFGNYATVIPCGWVLDETSGEYRYVEYASPENGMTTYVNDVSGDGKTAVGYCKIKGESWITYPCYWPTPDECVVIKDANVDYTSGTLSGNAFAISNNGRYAAITVDGTEPVLYSVEGQRIIRGLGTHANVSGLEIGGITDTGDIFGVYEYSGYGINRPFWYSMDNVMTVDFDYFIYLNAGGVDLPYRFSYWADENLEFTGVSADGSVIAGIDTFGPSWVLTCEPKVMSIPPSVTQVYANPSALGQVTVTFDRNKPEMYMYFTAKEYVVYRDGDEVTRIAVADLDAEGKTAVQYVDNNVAPGSHEYAVAVNYVDDGTGEELMSPKCGEVKIFLESNFDFPLYDDFESQSLTTNGWTVQRDYGETDFQNWGCPTFFGLDGSAYLNTNSDQRYPYSYSVVSRHIDASGKESVYVSFAAKWQYVNSTDWEIDRDTLSLEISSDGIEWEVVKDFLMPDYVPDGWNFHYFDITPWAAGKTFQVRFRMHGQAVAQYGWRIDNFAIDEKPQHEAPEAIGAADADGKFRLAWKNTLGAYQLNYLTNITRYADGLTLGNEGKEFIAVNKFEQQDLALYDGKYLTSVTTELNKYESEDLTPTRAAVVVYEDGKLIREQEITSPVFNSYFTVKLDEPVKIDASKELMFGLKLIEYGADQCPLVYMNSTLYKQGKSDLYSEDGGTTWKSLADYYATVPEHETEGMASWLVSGNVTDEADAAVGQYDTNQYGYEVYKNGQKYSDLFIHFLEPGFTDESSVEGDVYEVRAFYLDGTVSELSNQVKNNGTTGINNVEAGGAADGSYTVEDGRLTVNGDNARVEIYNASGSKVYDGAGRGVSLDKLGHGVFILKVYGEDGKTETRKLMF